MQENGYGQLREDIGKLLESTNRLNSWAERHDDDDKTRFSKLEKMQWLAMGGLSVLTLASISDIIKNFLT